MPLFEIDAKRPALVRAAASARGFGTDAQRVVDKNLDSLLGEQVFPVAQGTSDNEPYLLALDVAGLPVVIDIVAHLTEELLTRALSHAGAAGNLTRTELAERYAAGTAQFDRDIGTFYDNVPITRSTAARRQGARLIVICQSVEAGILDALDFLRQPGSPVAVLRLNVVHTADGRRFVDVSPLAISRDLGRAAVSPALLDSSGDFEEGVAVGRALTGKQPVVVRVPHREHSAPAMVSRADRRRAQQQAVDATWAAAEEPRAEPHQSFGAQPDSRRSGERTAAPAANAGLAENAGGHVPAGSRAADRAAERDRLATRLSRRAARESAHRPTDVPVYDTPPPTHLDREPDADPGLPRPSGGLGAPPSSPDRRADPARGAGYPGAVSHSRAAAHANGGFAPSGSAGLGEWGHPSNVDHPSDAHRSNVDHPSDAHPSDAHPSDMDYPSDATVPSADPARRGWTSAQEPVTDWTPGAETKAYLGQTPAEWAQGAEMTRSGASIYSAEELTGGSPTDETRVSASSGYGPVSSSAASGAVGADARGGAAPWNDDGAPGAHGADVSASELLASRPLPDPPPEPLGPEDDPDLIDLAAQIGRPVTLIWSRPRRGQRFEAVLHPDGYIELADGERFRHPDIAAVAVSGSASADGWSVWRIGEDGPTLTDEFRARHT